MANVILLNGSSSSGKTTLAQTLQQLLPEPYQYIGLDQFRDGMPMRVRGLNAPADTEGALGMNVVPSTLAGEPVTEIQLGEYGDAVMAGMRRAVATFAERGIPVIVDDLLFKPHYLVDYAAVLNHETTWVIAVKCDLAVINQREAGRLGRFPGTATAHHELIHAHVPEYDLEIDTTHESPKESAQRVLARLEHPPTALTRVSTQ